MLHSEVCLELQLRALLISPLRAHISARDELSMSLQAGVFDTSAHLLWTCSLPNLGALFAADKDEQ